MLLTSVIIVLREVLEAALLVSILSAMSVAHDIHRGWTGWALACGFLAALALALGIDTVTGWFDGMGQEISSAFMQFAIFLCMMAFVFMARVRAGTVRWSQPGLVAIMVIIVLLAVAREGFEVLVYVSGFAVDVGQLLIVLVGSGIGAGIGISAGVLIYYLLCTMSRTRAGHVSLLLLVLVSAGMSSQAALLLVQADWLPSRLPLWDTSAVLPESSVTGQLLYALIGYQANPDAIQAGFYFGGMLLMSAVIAYAGHYRRQRSRQ